MVVSNADFLIFARVFLNAIMLAERAFIFSFIGGVLSLGFPVFKNYYPDKILIFPVNFLWKIQKILIKLVSYGKNMANLEPRLLKFAVFSLLNREICRDGFA